MNFRWPVIYHYWRNWKGHHFCSVWTLTPFLHLSLYETRTLKYQSGWKTVWWPMFGLQHLALKRMEVSDEVNILVSKMRACTRSLHQLRNAPSTQVTLSLFERWGTTSVEWIIQWGCSERSTGVDKFWKYRNGFPILLSVFDEGYWIFKR